MEKSDHVPKLVVKPRKRAHRVLPVMAVYGGNVLSESFEISTVEQLVDTLPTLTPTLFAKLGAADFIGELNRVYLLKTPRSWQWRASTYERDICTPDGVRVASRVSTAIHYFGWKGKVYHKIIDPVTMYGHKLETVYSGQVSVVVSDPEWEKLVRLLKWAVTVRDFCAENEIDVRPTIGGISSQFLTDRRFYPNPRRKVPAKINQRVRENLPGNHYKLNIMPDPSNNFSAYYLDQHRAHHYHARTAALPDSNNCYAYGDFLHLKDIMFDRTSEQFCGLYCLDLCAPKRQPPFDWAAPGKQFVYSNELHHLLDVGYVVNGVYAAWGSLHRDAGLGRYAAFAEEQLDRFDDAPWLKPLLLATYGTLATRPKCTDSIFRLASVGEPVRIPTGKRELMGLRNKGTRKLEPRIAHVLQRGMIEAACRSDSIGLAQWLDSTGQRILSIYADAVIVEANDDKPLPVLPEPWRCKQELNHLQFVNQQAFLSDGMTKLPGVSREILKYRQHRKPGYAPRMTDVLGIQTTRRI